MEKKQTHKFNFKAHNYSGHKIFGLQISVAQKKKLFDSVYLSFFFFFFLFFTDEFLAIHSIALEKLLCVRSKQALLID